MKKATTALIYITSLLMLATAAVYFLASYADSTEDTSEHAVQVEIILFLAVAVAYVPVGIWMLKNKMNSRAPYVISITISLALIVLYVIAKITSVPIVGLERDIGIIDIASKILQVTIVITSTILLPTLKRSQNYEIHSY